MRTCSTCGTPITVYSRTGRCNRHRLTAEQIEAIRKGCIERKLWTLQTPEQRADHVANAKRSKGVHNARMDWCPAYLLADYYAMGAKKIPAAERKEIILAQYKRDRARKMQADIRSAGPLRVCDRLSTNAANTDTCSADFSRRSA